MNSIIWIICKVCGQNGCQREYLKTNLLLIALDSLFLLLIFAPNIAYTLIEIKIRPMSSLKHIQK